MENYHEVLLLWRLEFTFFTVQKMSINELLSRLRKKYRVSAFKMFSFCVAVENKNYNIYYCGKIHWSVEQHEKGSILWHFTWLKWFMILSVPFSLINIRFFRIWFVLNNLRLFSLDVVLIIFPLCNLVGSQRWFFMPLGFSPFIEHCVWECSTFWKLIFMSATFQLIFWKKKSINLQKVQKISNQKSKAWY